MSNTSWISVLTVLVVLPATACACIWDHDTTLQEKSRFPGTLELITGKFLRHSPEFYYWRIRDREAKLAAGAIDPALFDDLGVAYEMTGQHARAVEIMIAKEELHPGLYETYSNLGTFHILAGDFEKGLPFIDQALAINPDAHFGREKYQKWLVEYALTRRKEGKLVFPMWKQNKGWFEQEATFTDFVAKKLGQKRLSLDERQKAVKGVLGMMRFANYKNPLLLEALADLLLVDPDVQVDAKQLATRAFLQASYGAGDEKLREAYRALAERAIIFQATARGGSDQLKLADLEASFKAELADAATWYTDLKKQELSWIENGKDADAEFDKLYDTDPAVVAERDNLVLVHNESTGWFGSWSWWLGLIGTLAGTAALLLWVGRQFKNA
jgi:hypothetical protein